MLHRSPISALQGAIDQDESESLQADVMRFMAILGLCLMVIFALVQSLPSVSESREEMRAREAESAALTVEIAELRRQLSVLGAQNREASAQVRQYEQTVEQLFEQVQDSQGTNARMAELTQERDQLLAEQLLSYQQLGKLQEQLQAQESVLSAMQTRTDSASTAEAQLQDDTAPISAEESVNSDNQSTRAQAETQEQSVEAEGFRLTFASNEAFFRLVKNAEISVFVITPENEGFRLDNNADRLLPAPLPSAIQDINKASLPPSLPTVLSRQKISSQSRWGVVLSDRVLQSINKAQTNARGGTLSIEGSGDVKLR